MPRLIGFFEELADEAEDFFDDFGEFFFDRKRPRKIDERKVNLNGAITRVRPAYLFAERLDNILKLVFGVSMCLSAITASFLGYSTLSQLLEGLIHGTGGRIIIFIIGISTLTTGLWKLIQLQPTGKE